MRNRRVVKYVCSDCGNCWDVVEEVVDMRTNESYPNPRDTWCHKCGGPGEPLIEDHH